MPTEELVNPKQANNAEIVKKEAEDKRKIRISNEKILTIGNKKIKKISFERQINGKWVKGNTKQIYLGKKEKKSEGKK